MSILLRTAGWFSIPSTSALVIRLQWATVPKCAPLSDVLISYIALDMHMVFSHIQLYYALVVIHQRATNDIYVEGLFALFTICWGYPEARREAICYLSTFRRGVSLVRFHTISSTFPRQP